MIQRLLTLRCQLPHEAVHIRAVLGADGGNAAVVGHAPKEKLIVLQHNRTHRCGIGTPVGHLVQIDIASVGEVKFLLHQSTSFRMPPMET